MFLDVAMVVDRPHTAYNQSKVISLQHDTTIPRHSGVESGVSGPMIGETPVFLPLSPSPNRSGAARVDCLSH